MFSRVFISISMATCVAATPLALADEDTSDVIAKCALETVAEDRIACLEAALRGAPEETELVEAAPQPDAQPIAKPAPEPIMTAEPAPIQPATPVVEELGAEQVAARAPTNQAQVRDTSRQTFAVSSTRTVPYEKLEITTAEGQVWRQIRGDSQKVRIPRKHRDNLTAEIWRGPVSGYKLRLVELKRTIRVERLK